MKKNVFLMLAVALFALAACVKESGEKGKTAGEGQAWMALNISAPAPTRALHDSDKDNGTADESKVNEVMIIAFDASENVTNVETIDYIQMNSTIRTKAFLISENAEKILVVVNPSPEFSAIVGNTFNTVNAALSEDVEDLMSNGFMMTNSAGKLEPYGGESIQKYTAATETAAYNNPFSLYVDRVVAKVRLMCSAWPAANRSSEGRIEAGNCRISDLEWSLNITNKRYYPISKREFSTNNYGLFSPGQGVWNDRYALGGYRIDPNYGAETPAPTGGSRDQYNNNFHNIGGNIDWNDIQWINARSYYELGEYLYCLENTFDKDHSMHAYTTQAILKAKMYPWDVQYPEADYGSLNYELESWFNFYGEAYTAESLVAWIQYNYDENQDETLLALFNTLARSVLGSYTDLTKDNIETGLKAVIEDMETKLGYSIQSLGSTSPGDYGIGHNVGGLYFYNHGYCYYQIMIKHDNNNIATDNLLGEYGVVRNSLYDINISKISGPGMPTIPDPETEIEIPNETANQYLNVVININPWTWYTQEEEL